MDVTIYLLVLFSFTTIALCKDIFKIDIIDRPGGCERIAEVGDKLSIHYDGFLSTGKPFDSSRSRNQPFTFILGEKQVIDCWEQGIQKMCVGEKRKLTCPPNYAYGDNGFGDIIPAKSTLVFDLELLDILTDKEETKNEQKEKNNEEKIENESHEHASEHVHAHELAHDNEFEGADKDGNGIISREEMTEYIKNYQPESGEEVEHPAEELATLVSEIFQADDTNKDGVLSKEEFYQLQGNEDEMEEDEKDWKEEL